MGRSTMDLLPTLQELQSWKVSVLAVNGLQFDLSTPHGKLMVSILSSLAEFERDLLREQVRSGAAGRKGQRWRLAVK